MTAADCTTCFTPLHLVLYPCWAPLLSPYGLCLRIFQKKNDELWAPPPQVAEMWQCFCVAAPQQGEAAARTDWWRQTGSSLWGNISDCPEQSLCCPVPAHDTCKTWSDLSRFQLVKPHNWFIILCAVTTSPAAQPAHTAGQARPPDQIYGSHYTRQQMMQTEHINFMNNTPGLATGWPRVR